MKRLVSSFDITLISRGAANLPSEELIEGIRIIRAPLGVRSRLFVPFHYLISLSRKTDLLIDDGDVAFPWLTPIFSRQNKLAIIYQSVREIFSEELPSPLARTAKFAERQIDRLYHHLPIITVSPSTKHDLVGYGIPSRNIFVIPPGVDRGFLISEAELGIPRRQLVVCISRLVAYKGVQLLLRSLPNVVSQVKHLEVVIAGTGKYFEELKGLSEKLGLSPFVLFLQRPPHVWEAEKKRLLTEARLLVIPSIREGFGIVVLEANARGTPAVGWDVPGTRDSIIHDKTGLLVPPFQTDKLSDAISALLTDDNLRSRMGGAGLQWASDHPWESASEKFANIMMELTKG